MRSALETRLKLHVSLPSPPGVAAQIIELAQSPDISISHLASILAVDPALTAKVMRIANSPFYAQRRKFNNLRQALVLLGLNATITLALSFCLSGSLRRERSAGLDLDYFWRRALLAALGARAIGHALGRHDGEELFLAGLLQDIGMLALDRAIPELYAANPGVQYTHRQVCAVEQESLGIDHADAGGWLLREWQLPERLCKAVASSHASGAMADDPDTNEFVRCVATSGALADLWLSKDSTSEAFQVLAAQAEGQLGLDGDTAAAVLQQMREHISEAEAIFEINLVAATEADLLLEQAQELLLVRNLQMLEEARTLRQTANAFESRALELQERSQRDPLTGLHNRAYLDPVLSEEFAHAKEQGSPLSLIFADIDHFKRINDTFGHLAGDEVLQTAAELLRRCVRQTDVLARYGGEEFVILLPCSDEPQAQVVAERVVRLFRETPHKVAGHSDIAVTVSLGIATHGDPAQYERVSDLILAADQALYQAKGDGRDRWVAFRPLPGNLK